MTSTMLQQNNNNNYPCLNMSGSTRDMIQKCSRASLPFPSRLELGLGDLPLIRGLRAWALCSKNRRRAGGQAPTAPLPPPPPPPAAGRSTTGPRPADVYLSQEWGRMGYGLPLGLDARQAGIGALVTVATLKTSEGSGKTQTQCLFLRTEKGSCLYSTARPGSGAASSVVGGWLRGKTVGGGSRDPSGGRRDQSGANRVRVRSGRRWRKSCSAAGRSGESREEERQEEPDKGDVDVPSLQQDIRRARQEQDGPLTCCHHASPQSCSHCGPRVQRRGSQAESPGGGAQNRPHGEVKAARREKEASEPCIGALAEPNADLESPHSHPESLSGCCDEELNSQASLGKDGFSAEDEDTRREVMPIHANNESIQAVSEQATDKFTETQSGDLNEGNLNEEAAAASVSGFPEDMEDWSVKATPAEASLGSAASPPAEGSTCSTNHNTGGEQDCGVMGREELEVSRSQQQEPKSASNKSREETSVQLQDVPSSPHVFSCSSAECNGAERRDELQEENTEQRGKSEEEEEEEGGSSSRERGEDDVAADVWTFQSSAGGGRRRREKEAAGDTCATTTSGEHAGETGSRANPAPLLPPLGSMATSLPRLEVEEEEEEEGLGETPGDREGDQEGDRKHQRELEKQQLKEEEEEKRGSTVATEEESRKEEEEEEEDEFGVFMQAEGEPETAVSASVPCGSRASAAAAGDGADGGESTQWTPGWTDGSFHQSDDTWTAFPRDSSDERRDVVGQWWPSGAEGRSPDRLLANQNLAAIFADAFPSPPASSSSDSCDLDAVPTLTQLLRGGAGHDQGLLDSFHDLNKMICQRYKRANGKSRDLLLKTLQLEQPHAESIRPAPRTTSRRHSPGLPSANQHAHNAAAKRRLSYDYNRNVME
ncbi:uncharacterized protein V6R79_004927 [Siganus canaliculatus]